MKFHTFHHNIYLTNFNSNLPNYMNTSSSSVRNTVYAIMIALSLGLILGRILAVDTVNMQGLAKFRRDQIPRIIKDKDTRLQRSIAAGRSKITPEEKENILKNIQAGLERDATLSFPFFSANDRSRWCTIRALIEPNMRVPGAPYAIDFVMRERGWNTIDMVSHDGHYYSSKPPLYPTIVAGIYWVIYNTTGYSLAENPHAVVRAILILVNLPMMCLFLLCMTWLAERLGTGDWDRIFMVGTACFATFLSSFCIVLNNHLPAAVSVAVALYAAVNVVMDARLTRWNFLLLGISAAFAAANELPALSFSLAIITAVLVYIPWHEKHGTGRNIILMVSLAVGILLVIIPYFGTNYIAHHSLRPPYAHRSEGDNWYSYSYIDQSGKTVRSYWEDPKRLDTGEKDRMLYTFHLTLGHHGVFSLTPVWLLFIPGLAIWLKDSTDMRRRLLALMITLLTLLVFIFYIMRPLNDRNYGGNTCGLRWMFWLTPLWLVGILPVLPWMEKRRVTYILALMMLIFSALSVSYPIWNPWTQPWLNY